MQGIVCGFCGVDPDRYWWLDLRSIRNTVTHFSKLEQRRERTIWESSRFVASAMSKQAGKVKFAWEKADNGGKPTVELIKQIKERYESYLNSRKRSG